MFATSIRASQTAILIPVFPGEVYGITKALVADHLGTRREMCYARRSHVREPDRKVGQRGRRVPDNNESPPLATRQLPLEVR